MQASACVHPFPQTTECRNHPAKRGNEIFRHLYEAHWSEVHSYIARRVDAWPDVEDLAQETFLIAYKHIADYDPNLPALPWLLRIAGNLVVNYFRDQQAQKRRVEAGPTVNLAWSDDDNSVHDEPDHREYLPEDNPTLREMSDRIHLLMVNLADEDRRIVEALYFKGLSQREAAEKLNLTRRTFRDRHRRLLEDLRLWLEPDPAV